jgi:hypothetical protein
MRGRVVTINLDAIAPLRTFARLCSRCDADDHDIRRCPEPTPAPDPEPVDPRVAAIAELRLQIDAMDVETQQYDDVIRTCGIRIAENRARQVQLEAEIAQLRGGATR